jgi:gamma-glutamyltranspeptidase/glutathione hydrolase
MNKDESMSSARTRFSDRIEVVGTFGVVATSNYVASAVAMAVLERGGNAFDAATAAAFTLQVVEPHQFSLGGETIILMQAAAMHEPLVICGQGTTPAAATMERFLREGLDEIPGTGTLSAVVPGAVGAWLLLLRDHGTWPIEDILAYPIHYASRGFPATAEVLAGITLAEDAIRSDWAGSAEVYLRDGTKPKQGSLIVNEALASTYQRLLREAKAAGPDRTRQIEAATTAFYRGFVAERIEEFVLNQPVLDSTGERRRGLLTASDMAGWQAEYEAPLRCRYGEWDVFKAGPWSQGPVLLQALSLLAYRDLGPDPTGPEFIHEVVEACKLAFADREAWYGDPKFTHVPMARLLDDDYARARAALITDAPSAELRPGHVGEIPPRLPAYQVGAATEGGDTCHIDVIDRWGNMVAATPSGGWLHGSPIIPGLGFPLNTRAQMLWLQPDLASTLQPNMRPRTTLSPTLAHYRGVPNLVFGAQGADFQDQWILQFFLRHAGFGFDLQASVDAPMFYIEDMPSSKSPRVATPGTIVVDARFPPETIRALEARNHIVKTRGQRRWGRNCAASLYEGTFRGAASVSVPQSLALAR